MKPNRKSRPRQSEDGDDDRPSARSKQSRRTRSEEDDDPRAGRKRAKGSQVTRKKKQGSPVLLLALIGVAGLVVFGSAVGVYFAFFAKSPSGTSGDLVGPGKDPPRMGTFASVVTGGDGTWSARFAGSPRSELRTVPTPKGQSSAQVITDEAADGTYTIIAANHPGGPRSNLLDSDEDMDAAIKILLASVPGARVNTSSRYLHSGLYPTRDVTMTMSDGSRAIGRAMLSEQKFFFLLVVPKPGLKLDEARARQFFDLLKIL